MVKITEFYDDMAISFYFVQLVARTLRTSECHYFSWIMTTAL